MEVDRRPIAAKRTYVTSTSPDVLPRHVPLVPLANTASFALEARRRPVAAARVGVSVASEAAGVSPTLDVLDVLAKANRPAQSFVATAAGAMEMSRRPKAARRVSPAIRPSKVRKETPAPNLADTAWAAMEARRRPRATKRAAKLRDSVDGDFVGQHSVLHPEQVGEFALDANQLAEHAAWRLRMVNAAVDEAGDKVLAAMTDRALSDLARLNLDKDAAAKTAGGDAPNPFAALERMLDARMSSESPSSRGASHRGGANFPRRGSSADLARGASASNLQRCGSNANMSNVSGNILARDVNRPSRVHCAVESGGEVVCSVDDSGDVLLTVESERVSEKMDALARVMDEEDSRGAAR